MGDKVRITDYDIGSGNDHVRVSEWETGLPNDDVLMPLSQLMLSSELSSAFSISPEPRRRMIDVDRASRNTLSSLRGQSQHMLTKVNDLKSVSDDRGEEMVVEGEETVDLDLDGSDSRKLRRVDSGGGGEEADSKTLKRHRLVWTPQLHKRFIEVVAHLGVKNAVPKTIMQLMNVEGLTRENVASHLQKYRLYVKRMHGEEPSSSDFTIVSKSLHDSGTGAGGSGNGHARVPILMPYTPHMVPNPAGGGGDDRVYHHRFESNSHPYNMMMQQRDWSGNNFGSVLPYQHRMTSNDK